MEWNRIEIPCATLFFNARQFYVVCLRDTAFLSGAPFLFHCYCCWWCCCCFLAINQILFTMCSNRKMFPNKFMVCTLYLCVFFRFAPSFPSIHFVFVNRFTCRHRSSSCIRFHVPTFDNKNLKRFYKRVPMAGECARFVFQYNGCKRWSVVSLWQRFLTLSRSVCLYVVRSKQILWPINDIRNILKRHIVRATDSLFIGRKKTRKRMDFFRFYRQNVNAIKW